MVQSEELPQVEFLSRVSKLPVVSSAIGYASDAYGKAKDVSPTLIKNTLSTAEVTVKYAAGRVIPVVNTLERPIHVVDSLACKTLDKVEEILPIVTKTPTEIMSTTRNFVQDKLQPVQDGVETAKNIVANATDHVLDNRVGQFALGSVGSTVSMVHDCVDYLLPPGEHEDTNVEAPSKASEQLVWNVQRTFQVASKVQHRLFSRTQQAVHDLGVKGLSYSVALVSLVEWAQANWKEIQVSGLPTKLSELVAHYRIKAESSDESKGPLSDILILARELTKSIAQLTQNALIAVTQMIPIPSEATISLRENLQVALDTSKDMINRLTDTSSVSASIENVERFVKEQLPIVHNAMEMTKSFGSSVAALPERVILSMRAEPSRQVRFEEQQEDGDR